MSPPTTFLVALANETATAHLMADLALLIGPGDVITLSGDLGAGKTAAARAMSLRTRTFLSSSSRVPHSTSSIMAQRVRSASAVSMTYAVTTPRRGPAAC